jgi:hypothetical protein
MMFACRAFLDGGPGVTYAVLQSIYEYFIVLNQDELRTKRDFDIASARGFLLAEHRLPVLVKVRPHRND